MSRLVGGCRSLCSERPAVAFITKDTVFQGLSKAVQYGDFLAKAVMCDDPDPAEEETPQEALGQITDNSST